MDGRKPGDVIVYNWKNRKHLLIDVAVTNLLAVSKHPHLIANGPGNTAKHWDLYKMTYEFRPFIIETIGAFGPSALQLCKLSTEKGMQFFFCQIVTKNNRKMIITSSFKAQC